MTPSLTVHVSILLFGDESRAVELTYRAQTAIHSSKMYSKISDLLIISPSYVHVDATVDCAKKERWSCTWIM